MILDKNLIRCFSDYLIYMFYIDRKLFYKYGINILIIAVFVYIFTGMDIWRSLFIAITASLIFASMECYSPDFAYGANAGRSWGYNYNMFSEAYKALL
jgi:hypothetical protein